MKYSESKLKALKKAELIEYIKELENDVVIADETVKRLERTNDVLIEENKKLISKKSEKKDKFSQDEIEYLIKRLNFTYKNATMLDAINMCKSIIDKLEKMKGEK